MACFAQGAQHQVSAATSDRGTASPSNPPGGFVLWELRSTKFLNIKSPPATDCTEEVGGLDIKFDTLWTRGVQSLRSTLRCWFDQRKALRHLYRSMPLSCSWRELRSLMIGSRFC
jgi:hypothetical protein